MQSSIIVSILTGKGTENAMLPYEDERGITPLILGEFIDHLVL